jgi:hypothetical protein
MLGVLAVTVGVFVSCALLVSGGTGGSLPAIDAKAVAATVPTVTVERPPTPLPEAPPELAAGSEPRAVEPAAVEARALRIERRKAEVSPVRDVGF